MYNITVSLENNIAIHNLFRQPQATGITALTAHCNNNAKPFIPHNRIHRSPHHAWSCQMCRKYSRTNMHTQLCMSVHNHTEPYIHSYTYIYLLTCMTIHTCNALHRYKPNQSQHAPLHDLSGPLLSVRVDWMAIMIGGNEWQCTWWSLR